MFSILVLVLLLVTLEEDGELGLDVLLADPRAVLADPRVVLADPQGH